MRARHRQGGGVGECSSGVVCENHLLGSEFSEGMRTHAHTYIHFEYPLGKPIEVKLPNEFLKLPFRAGFDTVSGRAVERGGKGWRTADAVHLYSHHPVGLGEADT